MKITKKQLKRIIQEEIGRVMSEEGEPNPEQAVSNAADAVSELKQMEIDVGDEKFAEAVQAAVNKLVADGEMQEPKIQGSEKGLQEADPQLVAPLVSGSWAWWVIISGAPLGIMVLLAAEVKDYLQAKFGKKEDDVSLYPDEPPEDPWAEEEPEEDLREAIRREIALGLR
jgi:hypothetical protein